MAPASQPPLSLVVTADDFGIGLQTSRGILQAHALGPVTATSFMVITGKHAEESAPLLSEARNLDVGLHLVMTQCGHRPLVAKRASGLVDSDGNFFTNRQLWIRSWQGKLVVHAVAEEIAAQAELFARLAGRRPDYVDGHHHAHQLPGIRQALCDVVEKTQVLPPVTRSTIEPPGMMRAVSSSRLRRWAANYLGRRTARTYTARGLWANDSYFGMLSSKDLSRPFPWSEYLRHLPAQGVIEWVVHPGLADASLEHRDGYQLERVKELEALTNPMLAGEWKAFKPYLARKSKLAVGGAGGKKVESRK